MHLLLKWSLCIHTEGVRVEGLICKYLICVNGGVGWTTHNGKKKHF
uniref:Uncharacterized protein n=1 Tax=Anguilla anguilla TaxID=7936 RepID=A0A0E9W4I6_ANGAN